MKWQSYVDGKPIENLTEEENAAFQEAVINKIARFGFKVHKITTSEKRGNRNDSIYGSNAR